MLLAQQGTIGQVVNGAYHYFQKIAQGASGLNKLPDGSTYAYFNTFILFSDVNSLVCNLIAPPTGGMSFLAADPAGPGRRRLRLQLLVPACRRSTPLQATSPDAVGRDAARTADTSPHGRRQQRRQRRRPTRSTASSASPTHPSRRASAASSTSCSGGSS